jgi:hypothetical protein
MLTETEIKLKGMKVLTRGMGKVEAERFISLLLREPFDYTRWQQDLFSNMSVKELSNMAMEHRRTYKSRKKKHKRTTEGKRLEDKIKEE